MPTKEITMSEDFYALVNGSKIRYRVIDGPGIPLLMLNGIGANIETWSPLIDRLGERKIIMMDVPGVGKSRPRLLPKLMHNIVEEIITFMAFHMGEFKFDLLGFSWGGALSQEIVRLYPDMVNNLVLVSTTPGFEGKLPEPAVIGMATHPVRYYSKTVAKTIAPFIHGDDPTGEDLMLQNLITPHPIGFAHQLYAIIEWGRKRRPINTTHRTMIITGNNDPLLPHKNSLVLGSLFTKSKLHVISGAGHLWVLSHAAESSLLINDFLG